MMFSLIDWILDTLSCRAWQNAWIIIVEMLHQIWHAVKQGCVRLHNAMECISEAVSTVMESKIAG